MFNAARQSFILSAVICVLLGALFAARYVLAPYPVEAAFEGGMPIATALTRFSIAMPWLAAACAFVLTIWTLIVTVQLTVKYAPVTSRNYLPPQIFLIATGATVVSGEALSSLLGAWLLVLAMRQFVFSLHKGYRFGEVFRAGLYLGIIPLLYAPFAAAAVLIAPTALMIYRRSWRETVVCAVGGLLPVPTAGFIHWAAGADIDLIYRELWRHAIEIPAEAYYTQIPISAAIVAGLVLLLASIATGWSLTHKKSIRKTPYKFMMHVSFTLAALAASVALPGASPTLAPLLAVPVALAVPYAFSGKWTAASSVLYCVILGAVLAITIFSIL